MLTSKAIRIWSRVHTWSSLISTVFMLLLCITGLPLIFHHEIDHLLDGKSEPAQVPANTPPADLDRVVAAAAATFPDQAVQFMFWDRDDARSCHAQHWQDRRLDPENNRIVAARRTYRAVSGRVDDRRGFMYILFKLHIDLFAGLPGKLFLGLMGLLLLRRDRLRRGALLRPSCASWISAPCGASGRPRLKWLDLHNLLGIVTLVWAFTVGFTGVINTWADLIFKVWQYDQLAEMTAAYQGPPQRRAARRSVQAAVAAARELMPGMSSPSSPFPALRSPARSHYTVFMRGNDAAHVAAAASRCWSRRRPARSPTAASCPGT